MTDIDLAGTIIVFGIMWVLFFAWAANLIVDWCWRRNFGITSGWPYKGCPGTYEWERNLRLYNRRWAKIAKWNNLPTSITFTFDDDYGKWQKIDVGTKIETNGKRRTPKSGSEYAGEDIPHNEWGV